MARQQADQAFVASQSRPQAVSTEGFDPSRMARQMRQYLANLELRSNANPWGAPGPADKTAGYCVAEIPDWRLRQWIGALEAIAQPNP